MYLKYHILYEIDTGYINILIFLYWPKELKKKMSVASQGRITGSMHAIEPKHSFVIFMHA